MREIKFRGKRLDSGEWAYGDLRQIEGCTYILDYDIGDDGVSDIRRVFHIIDEVDPETVGQYTGRKDIDGVEIFEGDVVVAPYMYYGAVCELFWYNNHWAVRDKKGATIGFGFTDYPEEWAPRKIGNIHDHPELLGASATDSTESA